MGARRIANCGKSSFFQWGGSSWLEKLKKETASFRQKKENRRKVRIETKNDMK